MPLSTKNRVCDRCIRKKVKCDLQRPDCSRCMESGLPCAYSAERKKPGPPRGARRQRHGAASTTPASIEAQLTPGGQEDGVLLAPDQNPSGNGPVITSAELIEGFYRPQRDAQASASLGLHDPTYSPLDPAILSASQKIYPGYALSHEQERELLVHFFSEVHPAIPLFHIGHFLERYDNGAAERNLLVTIVTIAAKVLSPISFWEAEDLELCMKFLLETMSPESVSPEIHKGLDFFRLECLLAYYEFHQFPGSGSWMRISRLARRAYAVGVNHIDNQELCSAFDPASATDDEIEDWRYLFWCIYCLDSYSNISVGTPFVVELESINTALTRRPHDQAHGVPASVSRVFLADDIEDIWRTAKEIVSNGIMVNYNLHMVTTTVLRQAGYILRLRTEEKRLLTKTAALKGVLAALRLSLPSRYLNPTRNVLGGESCGDHHLRLTNILHLHMAIMILTVPLRLDENEAEFMQSWTESLEPCNNIVSVVEQWDTQHSPRIDPAICFIIFTALCFLELHRLSSANPTAPFLANIDHGQHLLALFLEHFSSLWAVPRFLIQQFRKTQTKYHETRLTYVDIDQLLNRFKAPLHPKLLEQLSQTSTPTSDMSMNPNAAMLPDDLWSFDMYDFNL
ncbi:hypothetical protein F4802DRAFT_555452 [Xylaria palmicola]|nr:hypothetical protein F4802DRAFT_555452 [Xylaria palmicola]